MLKMGDVMKNEGDAAAIDDSEGISGSTNRFYR